MSMKADSYAARAITLSCAVAIDMATATKDAAWDARAAFLTPIAKAFGTEIGQSVANTGIQVHGGMGFIEETGAAQFVRDVRVTAIYEGTNGIQAMDLVGRKLMDGGEAAFALLEEIEKQAEASRGRFPNMAGFVWDAAESLRETTEWMVAQTDVNERFAGAFPYLMAWGRVMGGHLQLASALADTPGGPRERLARYFIKRLMPEYAGYLTHAREGAKGLFDLSLEELMA